MLSCGGGQHTTQPTSTHGENEGDSASENAGAPVLARLRRNQPRPDDINATGDCPPSLQDAIARVRRSRSYHFGPICTAAQGDRWTAVFATGTPQEAVDVWVLLHDGSNNELHRVRRTPIGVHFTAGAIAHGYVYLSGESIQTDELPAGADALLAFALPRSGGADPQALDLSADDLTLLGAHERAELQRRVAALPSAEDLPSASITDALMRRISTNGAAALVAALPTSGSAPMLRAWETGVYEHVAALQHATGATDTHAVEAATFVHGLEQGLDCSLGDRCLVHPTPQPSPVFDASVPSHVLFRREGNNTVIAAIIDQGHRTEAQAAPSNDRLGSPTFDLADDRTTAESYTLDGTIEGRVAAISRGEVHIIAFGVASGQRHGAAVFVIPPNRAPRRFDEVTFVGIQTSAREMYFRDVDRNFEPEVVSVTRVGDNRDVIGVSTVLWPPAVIDRSTYTRFDAMRYTLGAASLADADRALRAYAPINADHDGTCHALQQLGNADPHALAAATPGGMINIDYATPGQPLFGEVHRVGAPEIRHAADGNAVLGPFVGVRCEDLACDWFQGYCRRPPTGRETGYLWLTGRRSTPLWGFSRLTGH
jgi:hypothetical protein